MPTYNDNDPDQAPPTKRLGVPDAEFNPRISAFMAAQLAYTTGRTQQGVASPTGAAAQAITYGLIFVGDELSKIREELSYLQNRGGN